MKHQLLALMVAMVRQKNNNITFSKVNTTFCLSLHYSGNESFLYLNKTDICKFKVNLKFAILKDNTSWNNFCLGKASKDFTKDEESEISLID